MFCLVKFTGFVLVVNFKATTSEKPSLQKNLCPLRKACNAVWHHLIVRGQTVAQKKWREKFDELSVLQTHRTGGRF